MDYDIFIIKTTKHYDCALARAKDSENAIAHLRYEKYEKIWYWEAKTTGQQVYKFCGNAQTSKQKNKADETTNWLKNKKVYFIKDCIVVKSKNKEFFIFFFYINGV